MRSRFGMALALAAGITAALAGAATAAAEGAGGKPPAEVRIEDLAWLAGSWGGEVRGAGATTRFEAYYTTPQGGVILSVSKAFGPQSKLSWFEFERFDARDGVLRVVPHPGGKASVSFTLVEYDPAARKAVFANPEHDHPKRITYQQVAPDRLLFLATGDPGSPVLEFSLSRLP